MTVRQPGLKLLALFIHQMSQPLTVLLGETELALQLPCSEGSLRAALERCLRGLERLSHLVSNFRVLGEVNDVARSSVSLVKIIEQAVEIHAPMAESAAWSIRRDIPEKSELYVRADPEVMIRALSIIFAKAVASLPPQGKIEIVLSSCQDVATLTVSYPESGPWVCPQSFRADTNDDLDWILAKEMIRLLGGTLEINKIFNPVPLKCVRMTLLLECGNLLPLSRSEACFRPVEKSLIACQQAGPPKAAASRGTPKC